MLKIFIFAIAVLFIVSVRAQSQPPRLPFKYSVDSQMTVQIKKFRFNDSGILKKSMKLHVYLNGREFWSQSGGPLDCYTWTNLANDTIFITGYMQGELGYGFMISLFGDSCRATSFAYSDSTIYKYNIRDTIFTDLMTPNNISQKVTLTKKPLFEEGEMIAGMVELESKEFYYLDKKPLSKFRIKLQVHFKTAPIKKSENNNGQWLMTSQRNIPTFNSQVLVCYN